MTARTDLDDGAAPSLTARSRVCDPHASTGGLVSFAVYALVLATVAASLYVPLFVRRSKARGTWRPAGPSSAASGRSA